MGSSAIEVNWRVPAWFPKTNKSALDQLTRYHTLLQKLNKTVNLISIKTLAMADAVHFSDSILAVSLIMSTNKIDEMHDFGSGNGFPGLVMAILYPEVRVKLVEFDSRKAECLNQMIAELGIKNAEVLVRKVEALPELSVKNAICRGFGPISKTLLPVRKAFAKGGKVYHMKGEEWAREIAEIPTQMCSVWLPGLVGEYKLPIGAAKFAIVVTEKIST